MNNYPLVSVGIPTYNSPEGLCRTLECITQQTHNNLEIIVSDNCSPNPEVEKLVKAFIDKDSRIQYFRQNENIGVINNFKFVLEKATGEYFMWAADDDQWASNFISECIKVYESNYDCISVFCHIKVIDTNTNKHIGNITPSSRASELKIARMMLNYVEIAPNLIYALHKTEVIRRIKLESFDWFDVHVTACLSSYGKILIIPQYLYTYGNNHPRKPYSLTGKYLDFKTFRLRSNELLKNNFSFLHRVLFLIWVYRISFKEEKSLKKIIDNWTKES